MADKIVLGADKRTEFGKGASRRARAEGKIPAVLYGHGSEPVHVLLPGHETMMALKHQNALINLEIGSDKEMAIAKDVQRDPVRRTIDHVDLLLVRKGEKITVDVAVHVEGEPVGGTIAVLENSTLSVAAEATHLPEFVTVSIEGLDDGDKIVAGDVDLPEGSVLVTDPATAVVVISVPRQEAEPEPEEVEGEEGEEGAEGEDGAEGGDAEAAEESSE